MRRRIFSDPQRCLVMWLERDVEDGGLRATLSRIRRNWPALVEDLELLFKVIKKMMRMDRWALQSY